MVKIEVVMRRTEKGSVDGFTVREFAEGERYMLPADLAEAFFSCDAADPAAAIDAAEKAEAAKPKGKAKA